MTPKLTLCAGVCLDQIFISWYDHFCKSFALSVLTEPAGSGIIFPICFFIIQKEGVTIERRRVRPLLRPQKHSKVNKNPFRRTTSTPEEPSTTNSRWCPGTYPAVMPCHQNLDICIGERQDVHTNSTGPSSPFPMLNEGDSRHAQVFHSSVGSPSLSVGSGYL